MIIGKSNHPVLVKKIPIQIWALRDEIEAQIDLKIKADGETPDLSDIEKYYGVKTNQTEDDVEIEATSEDTAEAPSEETPDNVVELGTGEAVVTESNDEEIAFHLNFKRQKPAKELISSGFAFLSDIDMQNILLFTKHPFTYGQSVVIEFLIPQSFIMSADIVHCHKITLNSRVISETKPDYRLNTKFTFLHPGERTNLRTFLKSIEPEIPAAPVKMPAKQEASDDDFSDLDL